MPIPFLPLLPLALPISVALCLYAVVQYVIA